MVAQQRGFHINGSSFLAAMFMSLFVIYRFDTASTLSEETRDPARAAAEAVLFSVISLFVISDVSCFRTLVAIPGLDDHGEERMGPARIVEANFYGFATLYLLVVSAAISSAACRSWPRRSGCAGHVTRQPAADLRVLCKVSPRLHTRCGAAS